MKTFFFLLFFFPILVCATEINDSELSRLKNAIEKTQTELKKEQAQLNQLNFEQQKYQTQLNDQELKLKKLVKKTYVNQEVISDDPSDKNRLTTYYRHLNQSEEKLINNSKQRLAEINNEQRKILARRRELFEFERSLEKKLAQETPNQSIAPVSSNRPNSFSTLHGNLNWPLTGIITQRFGSNLDSSGLKSNGIIIDTKNDHKVKAVYPGQVVFADKMRGLGLLIIIDHGKNYFTLYGNNNSLYKKKGDLVAANEVIATAQTNPGLYFGVRKGLKPLNPEIWLRHA